MGLIPSQQQAEEAILALIATGHKRIVLKGSAGTGKTFLINSLINRLKGDHYSYGGIYVTAPTHKAVQVIRGKIEDAESKEEWLHFCTLHSGLQLKMTRDYNTGKQVFKKGKENPRYPVWGRVCQLVAVDESSMVSTGLLDGEGGIEDYPDICFLFLGDDKQLPPVGESDSPVFNRDWPTVELTEIVRQKAGSPIIDLSNDLRLIQSKIPVLNEEGHGYFYLNSHYKAPGESRNGYQKIIRNLADVNGTDELKYLAYTNLDVNALNRDVRYEIYGGEPKRVELGESLIFNEPYSGGKGYKNNEEVKVEGVEDFMTSIKIPTDKSEVVYDLSGQGMLKSQRSLTGEQIGFDLLPIKVYKVNGDFHVLHEHSEDDLVKLEVLMKKKIKDKVYGWPVYYTVMEQLAKVNYNHAITVHKSQGSTYKTAIANIMNINFNKSAKEKQAMLYTAVTRASNNVVLYNVR